MLEEFMGRAVVLDLRSPYVCLGILAGCDERYFEVKDADMHDLRDSDTTRENYVAASRATGIKRNRRRILIAREEVVGISLFDDVVDV